MAILVSPSGIRRLQRLQRELIAVRVCPLNRGIIGGGLGVVSRYG